MEDVLVHDVGIFNQEVRAYPTIEAAMAAYKVLYNVEPEPDTVVYFSYFETPNGDVYFAITDESNVGISCAWEDVDNYIVWMDEEHTIYITDVACSEIGAEAWEVANYYC